MELVYVRFKGNRYILVLEFGQRNNKLCGVVSEAVPDGERQKMMAARPQLETMSLERRIQWLRDHCPYSYKTAYREILTNNIEIISRHPVGRI